MEMNNMSVIDNIIDFCKRRSRPSYLLPKPKPPSRKEIEATRKAWAERDQRRKELEESKTYLSYEIPYPVHLEDYINIDTDDWVEPNPVLYQIIVPLPQEFYYKGRKWRFTDEFWDGIWPYGWVFAKGVFKDDHCPRESDLQILKNSILDIHRYNQIRIDTFRLYAEKVDHYLAMGTEGVVEEIND
jgi:hypothetical protein